MKLFVTGGTGFTGAQVVSLLLKNGHQVRGLYRPTSDRSRLLRDQPETDWVQGDVSDVNTLAAVMRGADALINTVSLGLGYADSILQATKEAGIQRVIFLSTTAIFTQLNARSKNIRLAAERAIQSSGLQYTILRPTMIYGSPRDRNIWRLIRFIRNSPVVPVFGNGNSLQQPIYVDDVAQAIAGCLSSDQTLGNSYNIAGKNPLTYNQVIDTIALKLKKHIGKIYIPSHPVVSLLGFFERSHLPLPIKAEQVQRLKEDKSFSYQAAQKDFGFDPVSFEEGIALEIQYCK